MIALYILVSGFTFVIFYMIFSTYPISNNKKKKKKKQDPTKCPFCNLTYTHSKYTEGYIECERCGRYDSDDHVWAILYRRERIREYDIIHGEHNYE